MKLDEDDPRPDDFASHLARVKRYATVAGIFGGGAGLCYSIAYLILTDNPDMRAVIVMPVVCGMGISAKITGIALLFAPATFFGSDRGKEYLETIGTQSVFAARIVILICLLLGCALISVMVMGALQMTGVIAQPVRP